MGTSVPMNKTVQNKKNRAEQSPALVYNRLLFGVGVF